MSSFLHFRLYPESGCFVPPPSPSSLTDYYDCVLGFRLYPESDCYVPPPLPSSLTDYYDCVLGFRLSMMQNLLASTGVAGLVPGPGRPETPRSSKVRAVQLRTLCSAALQLLAHAPPPLTQMP
ncbi:unnamed protein product [Rangifer tarandus platyrhynchus]